MPYWDDGSGQSKKEYDAGGGYDHHGNQNLNNINNNNNNNNNPPPPVNIHQGPTAAEIEAEKQRKKAELQQRRMAEYDDFYTKFKGNTKKKSKYLEGLLKNDPLLETYKAKGLLDWDNIKTYDDDINKLIENPNIQNKGDQLGDLLKLQSGAWGYTKPWSSTDDSLYIDDLKEFDPNWTPGWTGDSKQERLNKRIAEVIGHEARHQVLGDDQGAPWKWDGKNMWAGDPYSDKVETNLADSGVWQNYQSKYDDNPLKFKDTHELVNTMGDFQSYNNPTIYDDIYGTIHGDMPRHLTSNVADELYDASVQAGKDFSARTVGEKYENIDPVIIEGYADQLMGDNSEIVELGIPRSEVVRMLKQEAEQMGTKEAMDVLKADYKDEYEYAKGGVARKKYVSGGILDITGDEQITTDEGNDISLVDESETGVSTLFMKKGGRVPFRGGGQDAASWGGSSNEDKGADANDGFSGGDTSSSSNNNNNNQGDGGWEMTQSYEDFNKTPVNTNYQPGSGSQNIQDYLEDEQTINEQKIQEQNDAWLDENPRWKTHIETKQKKEYHDNINEVISKINDFSLKNPESWQKHAAEKAINFAISKAAAAVPFGSIIMGIAGLLGVNVARELGLVKTDISGNVIGKNTVTGADLGFFDPEEYPEFWGKGPDDTGNDGPTAPVVAPVTEEIQDSYAMAGDWLQGYRDLKAKQALSASLQEKWADERQWLEETMFANSGGLANLFRVKNQ